MPSIFNARVLAHPSFVEPNLIITTAQASGFAAVLGGKGYRVKLGPVDKFVYQNRIDLRGSIASSQASYNKLPSSTIRGEFVQTATYQVMARAEYNDLDIAEAAEWNVSLPNAHRLAMHQAHAQYGRSACLFGINANNSEGLLNTPNSTSVNLPADSFNNTKVSTYDAGQMALWLLGQLQGALQRMYLLGTPARVVFLGPQRVLGQLQLQNIVQTTSYQRPGAGTATTAQVVKKVAEENGYEVEWAYDDTLIGQGAGGADAVLLVVPEAIVPTMNKVNTNVFATLSPTETAMTLQYADVAAPYEITTPLPGGATDVVSRMRISSGWAPRGQAVTVLSMPY